MKHKDTIDKINRKKDREKKMNVGGIFIIFIVLLLLLFFLSIFAFQPYRRRKRRTIRGATGSTGQMSIIIGATGMDGSTGGVILFTGPTGEGGNSTGPTGIIGPANNSNTGPTGGVVTSNTGPTGSAFMLTAQGTLTSAQIKSLSSTGFIQVISGLPNQIIVFWAGIMYYRFGTTPYAIAPDESNWIGLSYSPDSNVATSTYAAFGPDIAPFLTASQNSVGNLQAGQTPQGSVNVDALGQNLYFMTLNGFPPGADITAGDGTIEYVINYSYWTPP